MSKKPPTKAERDHMARVAALGCLACRQDGHGHSGPNTAIHHVRENGEPRNHRKVLPLCPAHHQHGGHGVALHAGEGTWERKYGTQTDLLRQVARELGDDA